MSTKRPAGKAAAKIAPIPKALTVLRLIGIGGMVGYTRAEQELANYCADIEAGESPDRRVELLVAKALAIFVLGRGSTEEKGIRAAKVLGITRKQGKEHFMILKSRDLARAVVDYQDLAAVHGDSSALDIAAKKHGIGQRAMRDRIRKYAKQADDLRRMDDVLRQCGALVGESLGSQKKK